MKSQNITLYRYHNAGSAQKRQSTLRQPRPSSIGRVCSKPLKTSAVVDAGCQEMQKHMQLSPRARRLQLVLTLYIHHKLLPFFLLLQQPFQYQSYWHIKLCVPCLVQAEEVKGKLAKMEIFIEQLQVNLARRDSIVQDLQATQDGQAALQCKHL